MHVQSAMVRAYHLVPPTSRNDWRRFLLPNYDGDLIGQRQKDKNVHFAERGQQERTYIEGVWNSIVHCLERQKRSSI